MSIDELIQQVRGGERVGLSLSETKVKINILPVFYDGEVLSDRMLVALETRWEALTCIVPVARMRKYEDEYQFAEEFFRNPQLFYSEEAEILEIERQISSTFGIEMSKLYEKESKKKVERPNDEHPTAESIMVHRLVSIYEQLCYRKEVLRHAEEFDREAPGAANVDLNGLMTAFTKSRLGLGILIGRLISNYWIASEISAVADEGLISLSRQKKATALSGDKSRLGKNDRKLSMLEAMEAIVESGQHLLAPTMQLLAQMAVDGLTKEQGDGIWKVGRHSAARYLDELRSELKTFDRVRKLESALLGN